MPAHGMKSSKTAEFTWEGRANDLEGLGKHPGRIQLLAQLLVWWNLRTAPKCAFIFVGAWCEPIVPASLAHGKAVCVCPCVQTGCALRVPSAPGKPSVCVKHFTKERGDFVLSCGWGEGSGGVSICPPGCNPPPHLSQVLSLGVQAPIHSVPLTFDVETPGSAPCFVDSVQEQYCFCGGGCVVLEVCCLPPCPSRTPPSPRCEPQLGLPGEHNARGANKPRPLYPTLFKA